MTPPEEIHHATCHCGAVTLRATLPTGLSSASRCTCRWGTGTAKHYFCKTCGIYMYHQRRSDPAQCGINLGCIDGAEPWLLEPIPYTDGINHPSDR